MSEQIEKHRKILQKLYLEALTLKRELQAEYGPENNSALLFWVSEMTTRCNEAGVTLPELAAYFRQVRESRANNN